MRLPYSTEHSPTAPWLRWRPPHSTSTPQTVSDTTTNLKSACNFVIFGKPPRARFILLPVGLLSRAEIHILSDKWCRCRKLLPLGSDSHDPLLSRSQVGRRARGFLRDSWREDGRMPQHDFANVRQGCVVLASDASPVTGPSACAT